MKVVEIYPSLARTATPTAVELEIPDGYNSLQLYLEVTVDPAAASLTMKIEELTPVSGTVVALLTDAALAAVGVSKLTVAQGVTAAANVAVAAVLPDKVKITVTHADADSITYQVYAVLR
jgi:hypothetical protein